MDDKALKKVCIRCGKEKPLEEFYRAPKGKFGRKAMCIECVSKALKEARERKKIENPKPELKRGRPNVSEIRSQAAKKAHANKRKRPNLASRKAEDIIKRLEKDGQPWLLMKYPFSVRGLAELSGVCYEIVIWQTIDSDNSYASMECDAKSALEIIKKYGLKERKRYKEENAVIWAKNDNLQELHRKYVKQRDQYTKKSKAARDLYFLLEDNKSIFLPEEYAALRDKAADAEQEYIVQRNAFTEEYTEKNGIIIYNI